MFAVDIYASFAETVEAGETCVMEHMMHSVVSSVVHTVSRYCCISGLNVVLSMRLQAASKV